MAQPPNRWSVVPELFPPAAAGVPPRRLHSPAESGDASGPNERRDRCSRAARDISVPPLLSRGTVDGGGFVGWAMKFRERRPVAGRPIGAAVQCGRGGIVRRSLFGAHRLGKFDVFGGGKEGGPGEL